MSVSIANKMGLVKEITGEEVRSVGASLFIDRELTASEIDEIMRKIEPQNIEEVDLFDRKTRIDL